MPINEELFTLQFTLYIGITKLNKYLSLLAFNYLYSNIYANIIQKCIF